MGRRFTFDYTELSKGKARLLRTASTPEEVLLWERVRNSQLGAPFRRQVPLGPYIVDFLCFKASLVLELDGSVHMSPDARAYDSVRDRYLHARGFTVLRILNCEVRDNMEEVIERIVSVLKQAQSRGRL